MSLKESRPENPQGRVVRLSDTGRCQRMRVFKSINKQHGPTYTPDPWPEETLRLFKLGLAVEDIEVEYIPGKFHANVPDENVLKQYTLKTGEYGIGHPDLIIKDEENMVAWLYEIKSSQKPEETHFHQLKAYAYHLGLDPKFDGYLIRPILYIAPRHGGMPYQYPVEVHQYDIQMIHSLADEVIHMAARRELPPRTCMNPIQGTHKLCQFVGACFDSWEPPPITDIEDPLILRNVRRLYELQQLREQYGEVDLVLEELTQIQAALILVLKPEVTYQAREFLLRYKISEYSSKQYAIAVKAGIDPRDEEAMKDFTNPTKRIKFTIMAYE